MYQFTSVTDRPTDTDIVAQARDVYITSRAKNAMSSAVLMITDWQLWKLDVWDRRISSSKSNTRCTDDTGDAAAPTETTD